VLIFRQWDDATEGAREVGLDLAAFDRFLNGGTY
jgi:hypothetical protein